ncbi:MAG: serine hydrolase [Pseudomonadota bacterium]
MIRAALLALTLAAPAAAQAPTPYDRAIAAGYKALTLCGGLFNALDSDAQRTVKNIERNDLAGIYPEYDALLPTLPAKVADNRVFVTYDSAMPPRVAIKRGAAGCVIMPIGTPPDVESDIPIWARHLGGEDYAPVIKARGSLATQIRRATSEEFGPRTKTTSVIVQMAGRVRAEYYSPDFGPLVPQRTWSVAKSLSGTIIGAAAQQGLVDVTKPATITEWDDERDPRSAITVDNLLRMASGLHSATAGNRTDAVYFGGVAVGEETVAWPLEAQPGTRFRYANNDILLAVRALSNLLEKRSPNPPWSSTFASELLFSRIGMRSTTAEQDWHGNYILSSQVWSTARDLARFGQLYLQDGVWNGERILPAGWVKYVTTPSGPQPEGEFGYGATFWLMNKSPGVPADTFAAFGNRGQYVVIVPSRQVVIVRRGEDPHGSRFDIAKFTAEVLAALK